MQYDERQVTTRRVDPEDPRADIPAQQVAVTDREVVARRTGTETLRRIVTLLFGLVQLVIGLRIVLLLLDAREANALVSFILDVSSVFVSPFEGILRTDALAAGGSVFDVAALAALIGWTILELIVLAVVNAASREP